MHLNLFKKIFTTKLTTKSLNQLFRCKVKNVYNDNICLDNIDFVKSKHKTKFLFRKIHRLKYRKKVLLF